MHSGCRPSQGRARFSPAIHCLQVHSCSTDAPPPSKPPPARGNCCWTGTPYRQTSACRQHCVGLCRPQTVPSRGELAYTRLHALTAPPHAMPASVVAGRAFSLHASLRPRLIAPCLPCPLRLAAARVTRQKAGWPQGRRRWGFLSKRRRGWGIPVPLDLGWRWGGGGSAGGGG